MYRKTALIFLFIISGCLLAQPRNLNLDEAIKIALQKNTQLQKSSEAIKSYESTVKTSYGALLPSVGASAGWNWNRVDGEGGITIRDGQIVNIPSTQDSRSYSVGAGTNWTLFDGLSSYANIAKSKNDLESARLSLQRLKQDIVFAVTSRYFAILGAKQLLRVREDDLAWNRKNLETITERNRLGAVTLADVYAQQVRVGNSEIALLQTQNDLDTKKSDLLNYLGLDVLEDIGFNDPVEESIKNDTTFNESFRELSTLVDEAINNRDDIKSYRLRIKSADESIKMAYGEYMPSLSNSMSFSTQGNKPGELFDTKVYSVGLSLSVPIFSGWSTQNRLQMAKVEKKTREIELTELERETKINLKTTYLNLLTAQKSLEVSTQNVQSAQQNRQIEQEKYNLGAGTLVNLLLASSEYTTALQNDIISRFNYETLKSQLEYYLGVLDFKKFE